MAAADDSLGPLPKGDRQDALQQLSLAALHSALPTELFLFRDERMDDKGVDGALEVKVDEGFTNCRGQFQLKATDSNETNRDGSVSCTVATSNLNYLCNFTGPRRRCHRQGPGGTGGRAVRCLGEAGRARLRRGNH